MLRGVSLKAKLMTAGLLLTVAPLCIIFAITIMQSRSVAKTAMSGLQTTTMQDLDHIIKGVYMMLETQEEVLQQTVNSGLNVARAIYARTGQARLSPDESASWNAVNQLTNETKTLSLPKMYAGATWLGQISEAGASAPIVDEVQRLTGITSTIFQRMNDDGDMIRVCTNVKKKDGTRAIGTYIPRTEPGGKTSAVIDAVLSGQIYRGRAFVVDKWYITVYEPIYGESNKVIGMLFVGIPQESAKALREAVMNIKVGKTGYVYVLDSKGNYVISKGGERDGENVLEAKDSDGNFMIKEILKKALPLGKNEVAEHKYMWKNQEDPKPRMKIARLMYFAPWDWVIGAGSYEDEFYESQAKVAAMGRRMNILISIIALITLAASTLVWILISGSIAGNVGKVVESLNESIDEISRGAGQMATTSQSLASGSSEQASSLEEISASLEEMSSMTKQNSDNANSANTLAAEAKKASEKGNEATRRMLDAMKVISESSAETSKIIKTIDEIAFQTNLLALNAAVEAARAGDAGRGFAVVAEEVRSLAKRAGDAAKNTAELIEKSVGNTAGGVKIADELTVALSEITSSAGKVSDLVAEIAAASQEQTQGINQVSIAVGQLDKVTQDNAAGAEESASAAEEIDAQTGNIAGLMKHLISVIKGAAAASRNSSGNFGNSSKLAATSHLHSRVHIQAHRKSSDIATSLQDTHASSSKATEKKLNPASQLPLEDDDFKGF